jgi:hypothetical protein
MNSQYYEAQNINIFEHYVRCEDDSQKRLRNYSMSEKAQVTKIKQVKARTENRWLKAIVVRK